MFSHWNPNVYKYRAWKNCNVWQTVTFFWALEISLYVDGGELRLSTLNSEQIPTVTVTFVQATFIQVTFVHVRNISAVFHFLFLWNLKGEFLGTYRTDSNCHSDICPGNICPGNICSGDICTYQEYLSCYWHYLD